MANNNQVTNGNFLSLAHEERLECLLRDSQADAYARRDFFELLMLSTVYVFRTGTFSKSAGLSPQHEVMSILSWSLDDGTVAVPCFTSIDALRRCKGGRAAFFEIEVTQLLAIGGGHRIIINSGSDDSFEFFAEETDSFLTLQPEKTLAKPSLAAIEMRRQTRELLLGSADSLDKSLLSALKIMCEFYAPIDAAYIALSHQGHQDEKPGILIGLVMNGGGDEDVITLSVHSVAYKLCGSSRTIEVMRVNDIEPGVHEYFSSHVQPFHQREKVTVGDENARTWWKSALGFGAQ